MVSIKDYRIESDVAVNGATVKAITDGEEQQEVDIIGHIISYTIGSDFIVPRDWLKTRMEELDLRITAPGGNVDLMLPPKVTPKRAFNRVRDRLVDEVSAERSDFRAEGKREIDGRMTHFESKKATNDEWHLTAESYFTAEELNAQKDGKQYDDGEFRQVTLGVFRYNKEHEGMLWDSKIDETNLLWDTWNIFESRAREMFAEMQESHIGRDIQKMLNRFTHHWTDSIKVRDGGAVYFVPAGYDEEVRALKTLIDEIDANYKHRGSDCELLRISVTDSDEERKQIEAKARKHVESQVESALSTAFDNLTDDDTVEDIAENLQDRLKGIDAFADDYNALLSAKLSAQEVLRERLSDLSGEQEAIVEEALEDAEEPPMA